MGPVTKHLEFFQKNFFKPNFCSPFIKDSIKETPRNVKMWNKSSQKFPRLLFQRLLRVGNVKPFKTVHIINDVLNASIILSERIKDDYGTKRVLGFDRDFYFI